MRFYRELDVENVGDVIYLELDGVWMNLRTKRGVNPPPSNMEEVDLDEEISALAAKIEVHVTIQEDFLLPGTDKSQLLEDAQNTLENAFPFTFDVRFGREDYCEVDEVWPFVWDVRAAAESRARR